MFIVEIPFRNLKMLQGWQGVRITETCTKSCCLLIVRICTCLQGGYIKRNLLNSLLNATILCDDSSLLRCLSVTCDVCTVSHPSHKKLEVTGVDSQVREMSKVRLLSVGNLVGYGVECEHDKWGVSNMSQHRQLLLCEGLSSLLYGSGLPLLLPVDPVSLLYKELAE